MNKERITYILIGILIALITFLLISFIVDIYKYRKQERMMERKKIEILGCELDELTEEIIDLYTHFYKLDYHVSVLEERLENNAVHDDK